MAILLLFGCAKNSSSAKDDSGDVSDALEGQITTINNGMGDINAGGGSLAFLSPAEQRFLNEESFWQKIGGYAERLFDSSLHATTTACSSSGSVDDTGQAFGTAAFTITRVWNACVRDGGAFRRNGTVYLGWAGLLTSQTNSTYVTNGTTLKRATSGLTMTRVSTGNYVDISGNDSANTVSSTNANQVFTWGATTATTRTFTLSINETRTGKNSSGTTRFRHVITTPTNLTVNVDTAAQTRTIASGTISVQHALANFTVSTTFSNMVWDMTTCQPKSGSANVSVSGSITGSGTLTFNSNGTVNFSYGTASGTISLPGC